MRRLLPLALLPVALLTPGCDDQGPRTPAAIVVTPNVPRVPLDGSMQLQVTVVDEDGRAIDGEPVALASSDPTVMTVGEDGLLTSVGPLDTVTITATSGGLAAEVEALVVPPPSSLVVQPDSLRLPVGELARLYIVVTDEHGEPDPDAELLIETDDPAVAGVDVDGFVWGRRSGVAVILVTSGDHRRDIPVFVTP